MRVKHNVLPDGKPQTVPFTVLAHLCGSKANVTEMGTGPFTKNGEGRTLTYFSLAAATLLFISLDANFRCVMKMDHHCPWINNCVGHRNHKSFTLFLIFVIIGCSHAAIILILTCLHHLFWVSIIVFPYDFRGRKE